MSASPDDLERAVARLRDVCLWWPTDEMWESSCGAAFIFNDGGPRENEFVYCHKCGKNIEIDWAVNA